MIFFTIIISLLLGSSIIPATAAEILHSKISLKNGIINYQFNASVNATPNAVFNVLSNHKYLPQLNKHIKSSTQESIGTKTIRIFKLEKCILNFCFDLNFEEEIEFSANSMSLVIIADGSSFHSGRSKWVTKKISGNQTRLSIIGQLKPKFWIPPVIGVYFLDKVFNEQISETVANLERKANERNEKAILF